MPYTRNQCKNAPIEPLILALLLAIATVLTHAPQTAASPAQQASSKLVLAFYYMWFSPADFGRSQMSDTPPTPYNSGDPAVIER